MKKHIKLAVLILCCTAALAWAAMAITHYRREQERNQCLYNLKCIDSAKRRWALETILSAHASQEASFEIIETNPIANKSPTVKEIGPCIDRDDMLCCPSGGTYTMGRVLEPPACSIHDHNILRSPMGFVVQEEGWRHHPIEGATVVLTDDSDKYWTNTTNPQGGARFNTWPNKAVFVVITKEGYITISNKVPLPDGVATAEIATLHKKQ